MTDDSVRELFISLSHSATRVSAANDLSTWAGADTALLFVRDPVVGVLIPAPGCAQTLHGGASWRRFLAKCSAAGRHTAQVEFPIGATVCAVAVATDSSVCVLLGGVPAESKVKAIEQWMPLLTAVLNAEQDAALARAEGVAAKEAAGTAQVLADALEGSRAEGSRLYAQLLEEQRRKDEFLAMLGHELRNPLSALLTGVEVLKASSDPQHISRMVDVMRRQTAQLSSLVDDLLDMSRVNRGQIELRLQSVPLKDIISEAVEQVRALITARRQQLVISVIDEPLTLNADRVRLIQIFANLLNNAAKYTDPGGRISITVTRDEKHVEVRVQDNGIGISPHMLDSIFDLFTQAPVALERAQGGLGIGLTLVRTLVMNHGGNVIAESAGLGKGATFIVRLPLQTQALPLLPSQADALGR